LGAITSVLDRPPASRVRLHADSKLDQRNDGDSVLNLKGRHAAFYGDLFAEQHPDLLAKSNTGFRESKHGPGRYAFFHDLTADDTAEIEAFLDAYQKLVIVGRNRNLDGVFGNELSSCVAFDYTFERQHESQPWTKTLIWQLVYDAKYRHCIGNAATIARFLKNALLRAYEHLMIGPVVVTYPPAEGDPSEKLPHMVSTVMFEELAQRSLSGCTLRHARAFLSRGKPRIKELQLADKAEAWREALASGRVSLSANPEGALVFVVDDLYESGVTLRCFAEYLRARGAREVRGLVCAKALRDTDNL